MSSDKKPKFGVCSKKLILQKSYFFKNYRKIYIEKNIFYKLFDTAAPCCHNVLKPGPEPDRDPLDEAGGHGGPGGVDTLLQLCHIGGPLLAQNAVNVVQDTVLKGCTTRARKWLVLFLPKLPPFLLRHLLSRARCMTCGTCSLHLG